MIGIDGALQRIDRLVEFDSGYWVLDYKSSGSSTERLEEYRKQVTTYCRAIEAVFGGRSVRGVLIFSDASLIELP